MPRRVFPTHHVSSRFATVAVVVCGHAALFTLLTIPDPLDPHASDDQRSTLGFIDLPEDLPAALASDQAAPIARRTNVVAAPAIPPAVESNAISQSPVDWDLAARRAAAREAARPEVRSFDFPEREPEPQPPKEFGWDKTHTERVSALPGGGILIRLNDNCAITLAPLPIGGCALGKRKARGDLFDGMQAPAELGDWR